MVRVNIQPAVFNVLYHRDLLTFPYLPPLKLLLILEYANGEIGFIVLSFTAKTLLAWITVGGVFYE